MGYWNLEVRRFLELAWQLLWKEQKDELLLDVSHISDFEFKTGLSREAIAKVDVRSHQPYEPELIVELWYKKKNPYFVTLYARHGPTDAIVSRNLSGLRSLPESYEPDEVLLAPTMMQVMDTDDTSDPCGGIT